MNRVEINGVKVVCRVEVAVRINQPRCSSAAVEIDDARIFCGELANLFVGTDGNDFTVVNGDSLRYRVMRIDGDNLAVGEDEIGRGRGGWTG